MAEEALHWFVTLQSGAVTPAEQTAFDAWYQAAPAHARAFDRIAAIAALPELDRANRALAAPVMPLQRQARKPPPLRMVAAALAACLVLAVGLTSVWPSLMPVTADIRTARGERRLVTLPDGSLVHLDAGSAITLAFDAGQRGVALLAGQAFFDVVPDPDRPFRVTAAHARVEVTGTGFSVNRTRQGDWVQLIHGQVTVASLEAPQHIVTLHPGDAVLGHADGLADVERPDPAVTLSWRDGRYHFRDQPLAQVVDQLRRYHAGPILLLSDRLAAIPVSGNYRTDDVEGALRSLAAIAGGQLDWLPGEIFLLR